MDIFLRECGRLLELPENEIRRLVRQRALPAYRLHDKYRIGRVDLLEWGIERPIRVSPRLFAVAENAPADSLRAALDAGSLGPLAPGGWETALASAQGLPEEVRSILLARLAPAFSIVEGGIAIQHPRAPLVASVDAPRLVGGYLDPPLVLPGAPDQEVALVFILVCPTIRSHLDLLSRLAFALHDDGIRQALSARADVETLRDRLLTVEAAGLLTGRRSVVP